VTSISLVGFVRDIILFGDVIIIIIIIVGDVIIIIIIVGDVIIIIVDIIVRDAIITIDHAVTIYDFVRDAIITIIRGTIIIIVGNVIGINVIKSARSVVGNQIGAKLPKFDYTVDDSAHRFLTVLFHIFQQSGLTSPPRVPDTRKVMWASKEPQEH
jgi:hypothetical protein